MFWSRKQHKRTAAEFALERGTDFHQAFGEIPAVYNEEGDRVEELPASADLENSLLIYNESVEEHLRFNIQQCTLKDVFDELDLVRGNYEEKAKGPSGILRRGARAVGDYADQITPWIELVPSDQGLSILSAGLKIIFGIAQQNSKNRDRILQAFDDIPDLIISVKDRQTQWATAQRGKILRTAAIKLYEVLARAIAQLIFLLNGSMSHAPKWSERASKIRRRVAQSSHTSRLIDSILNDVQNQAGTFDRCLQHVRDQRDIDTGADVADNKKSLNNLSNRMMDLSRDNNHGFSELSKKMDDLRPLPVITNYLYHVVVHVDQPQDDRSWEDWTSRPKPNLEPLLDELELHDMLGVSPQHSFNDIQLILKELDQFSSSAQAHAQQLFTSSAFTSWMASRRPSSLLVHGNFSESGPGRITPLSILCAMFSLHLRRNSNPENKSIIILHYFCGLHGSRYNPLDSLVGPNGLICSILAQLLQSGRCFNLDFINTHDLVNQLEAHNIQSLCSTFFELVERLPRKTTIICILDGLSEFTSEQFQDDLLDVLHILNRLVTHRTLPSTFKLLCTTPFARDRLLDQQLNVDYPLQLQISIEGAYEPSFALERGLENQMWQNDRLDRFRMQMQRKEAAEQANCYSDSDSNVSDW